MKFLSVKQKLTLWITLLMLLLTTLVLGILISISSSVATENTREMLSSTLRANLSGISQTEGRLTFSQEFAFTRNGVYTLVYSSGGALLAGQPPLGSPEDVDFENGESRLVTSGEDNYYLLDFWLPFSWEEGVWVRGMIQAPHVASVIDDLVGIALLLLPLMVIVSGVGAYLLARSTFRPIDRIIEAAGAISEGRDLSRRIGLPPGRDEISRLAQAFDHMFARLETSFEAEKQFTSDASHELRTPTAVILAQCDYTRKNACDTEQYSQAIEVIDRQARKMSALISQLLQMTRLEQGTQQVSLEQADLSQLVEVICEEQPGFPRGITLETDLQPEVMAWFDVTLMSRLVQNLVNNAVQYGRSGGHVWVVLREKKGQVCLSVRDDGVGIPADRLEKIWQRFYQVDGTRGSEGGAGLGLTMVRQIARLHGGEVTVESREGQGSLFTLRFAAEPERGEVTAKEK
ncbi:MAG: sensor histidine kinase [Eubacteriales bacterium]